MILLIIEDQYWVRWYVLAKDISKGIEKFESENHSVLSPDASLKEASRIKTITVVTENLIR